MHQVEFAENCLFERYGIIQHDWWFCAVASSAISNIYGVHLAQFDFGFGCIASFRFTDVLCDIFVVHTLAGPSHDE